MNDTLLKFIVNPSCPIIEVLKKIDANIQGIVYVCLNETLVGVITDGDIRRYILKNQTVDGKAQDVMNKNPKFLSLNDQNFGIAYMKKWKVNSIPILDEAGNIHTIAFLNKKKSRKTALNTPVVIMAGGKGSRLQPYTQILPKPLIPINEKTITEIIMDSFKEYNCNNFTMIVNYKKEFIKAFFKESEVKRNICFVDEDKFMGTAGGLKLIEGKIKEPFFLTNCDILIEEDYDKILEYHKQNHNIVTMVCALKKEVFPYGTVEVDKYGVILKLKEKPSFEFLTNTGFYVVDPILLTYIPLDTFIHITDVIQKCIDENMKVSVYPISEDLWFDMGQFDELEKMKAHLEKNSVDIL